MCVNMSPTISAAAGVCFDTTTYRSTNCLRFVVKGVYLFVVNDPDLCRCERELTEGSKKCSYTHNQTQRKNQAPKRRGTKARVSRC